jgi:hypothetical protein
MAITVTGGVVSSANKPSIKATVDTINFPTSNRVGGQVPVNAAGVMTLKAPPDYQNFAVNNVLKYADGNNNNNAQLTVTGVVGPSKYKVTRTA